MRLKASTRRTLKSLGKCWRGYATMRAGVHRSAGHRINEQDGNAAFDRNRGERSSGTGADACKKDRREALAQDDPDAHRPGAPDPWRNLLLPDERQQRVD